MSDAPLVALIASGALLAAVHRVASAWEQVAEVQVAAKPGSQAASIVPPAVDIPDDLVAVAMQENESWAQEELLRVIREKHEQYKDWNKVRAALGLGRRD